MSMITISHSNPPGQKRLVHHLLQGSQPLPAPSSHVVPGDALLCAMLAAVSAAAQQPGGTGARGAALANHAAMA